MIGIDRSIRMRSGFSFFAFSMASTPFCASATLKPQNFRYSPYISRGVGEVVDDEDKRFVFGLWHGFSGWSHFLSTIGRVNVNVEPLPS